MRVVVTGAAGKVGSQTVALLHDAGHEVIATDVKANRPVPVLLREMNLLDTAAVASLMPGADAVVHLGNHVHVRKGHRIAETFNENVAMNMNVFQAAIDAGVKRIVFASTIQVMASESGGDAPFPPYANHVASLPLSRDNPKNPGNSYSLSKSIGESMLEQYVVPHGLTGIALRFPLLVGPKWFEEYRKSPIRDDWHDSRITQAFALLATADAATAVVACLTANLSGYHVFFPAISQVNGPLVPQAIAKWYRNVSLKRPIEQINSLVDHSHLTQATGWRPRHLL